MHSYTHAYHTYTHTRTQTHTHIRMQTHRYTHAHVHTCIHTHKHAYVHVKIHLYTRTQRERQNWAEERQRHNQTAAPTSSLVQFIHTQAVDNYPDRLANGARIELFFVKKMQTRQLIVHCECWWNICSKFSEIKIKLHVHKELLRQEFT